MDEIDDIYEKLKQLPQIKNATLSDIFNQRVKLYNEEKCSNAVILGLEFAMIWKTIDEFIKQTNEIFAGITKKIKRKTNDNRHNTRKALEIAINAMESAGTHNSINCIARGEDPSKDDVGITINHALEQITALKQKDVK